MAGRTVDKHYRMYMDGYDVSGYSRQAGPLTWAYDMPELTAWTDGVRGYLASRAQVAMGNYNVVLDSDGTSAMHELAKARNGSQTPAILTLAMGMRAAPALGDPVFTVQTPFSAYTAASDGGAMVATIETPGQAANATTLKHEKPWGVVLQPFDIVDPQAANGSAGTDNPTGGATSYGGYMVYHVYAGNGTAQIYVEDSADNVNFAALSGATTASTDWSITAPTAGIVALSNTATVRRYLRIQYVESGCSSLTFFLTFVRNYHP